MTSYLEQYQAKSGGVTLHAWTEIDGFKKENYYLTGAPGSPVAPWFRAVLRRKALVDIIHFPYSPSGFYA